MMGAPAVATRTMHGAVLTAPRRATLRLVPMPEPREGEVRVRLEGCGVCASSLPLWQGRDWFDYPRAAGEPGHEGWGVVDALGPGVSVPAVGQRVAMLSHHAFAEHDVAPADGLVLLPAALDGHPFPGEALGCAMNVWARSDVGAGQRVAVVGVGFLGALLVQLAVGAGAEVVAISRRPFARHVASVCGATWTLPLDGSGGVERRVHDLTGGGGCERVIEATGAQRGLDVAGAITAERGRLIVAGYHQDGPRQVDMQQWNWKGIDVVNAHERDPRVYAGGMRAAVEAVCSGRLDPEPLYTHHMGLDQLDRAFALMEKRPEGFLKALLAI